jgi:hypothetical protein
LAIGAKIMRYFLWCLLFAGISLTTVFLNLFHPNFSFITNCIILSALLIIVTTFYYYQFSPILIKNEEYTTNILGILFEALEAEIIVVRPQCNNLGVNIMKVKRRILKPWAKYLEVNYYCGEYTDSELEQKYDNGVGCCGFSLSSNSQVYYDSVSQHQTSLHMTSTQQSVTQHIKSILSTPIYSPNDALRIHPIAILNLDSIDGINVTGFDQPAIQEIVANFTTLMNRQLM